MKEIFYGGLDFYEKLLTMLKLISDDKEEDHFVINSLNFFYSNNQAFLDDNVMISLIM